MRERGSVGRSAGAKVTYVVSEASTARFTIERAEPGPRARSLRGSFVHGAVRGRNALRFTGRLRGRRLAAGRYNLVIKAVDVTGDRSRAKRVGFGIIP
jgi:hypothetical protein